MSDALVTNAPIADAADKSQAKKPQAAAPAPYVDVDTGHDYDGIREFDNRLPNWWLATLWGAVAFAVGYWFYFHTTGTGLDSREAYRADLAAVAAEAEERREAMIASGELAPLDDDQLLAMASDDAAVQKGKATYGTVCAACHGADGGGIVGPNLTDPYWIHGHNPVAIHHVVANGVGAKGMPAWKSQLGDQGVKEVVAYVLTLKGTTPASPKPPQGKDKDGNAP